MSLRPTIVITFWQSVDSFEPSFSLLNVYILFNGNFCNPTDFTNVSVQDALMPIFSTYIYYNIKDDFLKYKYDYYCISYKTYQHITILISIFQNRFHFRNQSQLLVVHKSQIKLQNSINMLQLFMHNHIVLFWHVTLNNFPQAN